MSGTSLKVLMMVMMVFDHIGYFISPKMAGIFHLLTRPVAQVFAYLSVEGYIHTRDKKKYMLRLFMASFIMAIGNIVVNKFIVKDIKYFVHNNIFLTLALGVTSLYIIDEFLRKDRRLLGSIFLFIVLGASLFTEGGVIILPFMIITYLFKDRVAMRNLGYVLLTVLFFKMAYVKYDSLGETLNMLMYNSDFLMVAGLPFIYIYNGKRGFTNKFTKYMFYVFYPLHLWIIAILASKIL